MRERRNATLSHGFKLERALLYPADLAEDFWPVEMSRPSVFADIRTTVRVEPPASSPVFVFNYPRMTSSMLDSRRRRVAFSG